MNKNEDLSELVSEMLIKQDKTNEILEEFVAISVKQWELQYKFNDLMGKFEQYSSNSAY